MRRWGNFLFSSGFQHVLDLIGDANIGGIRFREDRQGKILFPRAGLRRAGAEIISLEIVCTG